MDFEIHRFEFLEKVEMLSNFVSTLTFKYIACFFRNSVVDFFLGALHRRHKFPNAGNRKYDLLKQYDIRLTLKYSLHCYKLDMLKNFRIYYQI